VSRRSARPLSSSTGDDLHKVAEICAEMHGPPCAVETAAGVPLLMVVAAAAVALLAACEPRTRQWTPFAADATTSRS